MLFALPLAPQLVPAACALAAGICSLATRVGVAHGPRIIELVDILFAEGAAGAAMAGTATRQAARLAPLTLDRLTKEFHDLPNARGTITMAYDLVQQALFGPVKLYGKEVKAVLDHCLEHAFSGLRAQEGIRASSGQPLRVLTAKAPNRKAAVIVKPEEGGGGPAPMNRQAGWLAYLRELTKARQGAKPPFLR